MKNCSKTIRLNYLKSDYGGRFCRSIYVFLKASTKCKYALKELLTRHDIDLFDLTDKAASRRLDQCHPEDCLNELLKTASLGSGLFEPILFWQLYCQRKLTCNIVALI